MHIIFFKGRVSKMSILVWLDAFWAIKLGLKHSCEKAKYIFSLSPM